MSFANMPPWLDPKWPINHIEQEKIMAKWEIHKRAGNLFDYVWWRFMPGVTIKVKWPVGEIVAGPGPSDPRWYDLGGASYVKFESADPNDHYRPTLEQQVGRQRWDWNWRLTGNDAETNTLTIKFRRGKEQYATLFSLKWS